MLRTQEYQVQMSSNYHLDRYLEIFQMSLCWFRRVGNSKSFSILKSIIWSSGYISHLPFGLQVAFNLQPLVQWQLKITVMLDKGTFNLYQSFSHCSTPGIIWRKLDACQFAYSYNQPHRSSPHMPISPISSCWIPGAYLSLNWAPLALGHLILGPHPTPPPLHALFHLPLLKIAFRKENQLIHCAAFLCGDCLVPGSECHFGSNCNSRIV